MAELAWRPVAAPDFSTALEGIRSFNQMLGGAFSGLERGIKEFDTANTEQVNKGLMLNLLQQQDAQKLKESIASGQAFAGIDPRRISADTINAFAARPTALLEQDRAFRSNRLASEEDAFAPVFAQAATVARTDEGAASKLLSDYATAHPGLGLNAMRNGFQDVQNIRKGTVGIAGDLLRNAGQEIRNKTDQRDYDWAGEDRALAQKADALAEQIASQASDIYGADKLLRGMKVDPRLAGAARARLGLPAIMDYSPLAGAGAMGDPSGSNGSPFDTVMANGQFGKPPAPLTSMTVGQVLDFGKNVLIPNSKGKVGAGDLGSSAVGAYQIVSSTIQSYAKKLGISPNQKFDAQTQDRIAKAIFEDNRGSADALRRQWVSLSPKDAEAVRKMPWEQARLHIASRETSAAPDALTLALSGSVTAQGTRNADMSRNAGALADNFLKAYSNNSVTADVAQELAKSTFKGGDPAYIAQQIDQVIAKARAQKVTINAALAGEILRESATSSKWSRNAPSWLTSNLGSGMYADDSKVSEYIRKIGNGDLDKTIVANDQSATLQGQRQLAQQAYNVALTRYNQAMAAAAQGKPVDPAIVAAMRNAQFALFGTNANVAQTPGMASFNRPPAPPRVLAPNRVVTPQRSPTPPNINAAWAEGIARNLPRR